MRTRFINISHLINTDENPSTLKKGKDLSFIPTLENAFLISENGRIVSYGDMKDLSGHSDHEIDCKGNILMPTYCDSHTHIVFAESRHKEFRMRIEGKSYEEIADEGGGILNSAEKLRNKSESELYDFASGVLEEMAKKKTGSGG